MTTSVIKGEQSFRAQNGEDRWLDAYFGAKSSGFFVEIGAFDGYNLSNTFHFEQLGWTGILVEPDPEKAALCRTYRPRSHTYQCAMVGPEAAGEITFYQVEDAGVFSTTSLTGSHESRLSGKGLEFRKLTVPARTLDSVLEEISPERIDFVTIDVEGGELAVLRGFDILRWKPELVVVETNTKLRDPRVRDYFLAHGYAYHRSIDVNDFYRRITGGNGGLANMATRAIDTTCYLVHRIRRRVRRMGELAARAWHKRVIGRR